MRVDLPDGRVIEYVNDARGRWIGKKIDAQLVRQYVWDGEQQIVAEADATGTIISRHIFASGGNSPDLIVRGTDVYRVIKDQLGSPKLIVNSSDASDVLMSARYDEFGNMDGIGIGEVAFGFARGLFDEDTGLVRFGARDYDPTLGRWMSKDPLRFDGGDNLYAYCSDELQ